MLLGIDCYFDYVQVAKETIEKGVLLWLPQMKQASNVDAATADSVHVSDGCFNLFQQALFNQQHFSVQEVGVLFSLWYGVVLDCVTCSFDGKLGVGYFCQTAFSTN